MTNEQQILNQLAQLLHSYRVDNYESAHLEYSHSADKSWNSFSNWYVINGRNVASLQFSELKSKAEKLCEQLYEEMKARNDWRKFELTLANGKAKVNFSYEAE